MLWLINNLQQLTSGVDNESDGIDVYFQALYKWTHIRQLESETEDAYQKRVDTVTQNLILAGGGEVLCPKKILKGQAADKDNPTPEERKDITK